MKYNKETIEKIITAYNNGQSMTSIANDYNTYATSIRRLLIKNNVELRHDSLKEGQLYVKHGEELIEWAKAQGRPVTKTELAKLIGVKHLSPSYFIKYPELGQYVATREQNELKEYSQKLYDWLQKNNIQYKPNDRTRLKVSVTALLLGDYSDIVLQIAIKPKCMSLKKYSEDMIEKKNRAHEQDMTILFLHKTDFEDLDLLKERL